MSAADIDHADRLWQAALAFEQAIAAAKADGIRVRAALSDDGMFVLDIVRPIMPSHAEPMVLTGVVGEDTGA
jgi:hypothetical protein